MNFRLKNKEKNQKKKDYFDDDDNDDDSNNFYSSSYSSSSSSSNININSIVNSSTKTSLQEEEIDPLDAFMAQNEIQIKVEAEKPKIVNENPEIVSGFNSDVDEYEIENIKDGHHEIEYDSDGIPIGTRVGGKAYVEPLPPIDHSQIKYQPFKKNFYTPSSRILDMSEDEVKNYKEELEINATGSNIPRPIRSFIDAGFPPQLLREIVKHGYEAPTAIQSQALPVALSGRDLIGLAKTGSGKTLSFIWPLIIHILDQPQMELGDGPIGLILSPTRELTAQIYSEAKKFTQIFNIRVCAIFGGEGKWQMSQALKEAPEIVVATPGRLIDLISDRSTNLKRCTMVVLDEADRMFDLGFEYQMRSIVNNIRPDRQTLLFTATMKKKIERFTHDIIKNPVTITIGTIGHANPDIQQIIEIVSDDQAKWLWLTNKLTECLSVGKVLIFVNSKSDCETLSTSLSQHLVTLTQTNCVDTIHGDKSQTERSNSIKRFKSGECWILVATDVASRGLDIKDVRTVINYHSTSNIETYIHRIGRTGRMGIDGIVPGVAYTLLNSKSSSDQSFSVYLVKLLIDSGLNTSITPELLSLAQSNPQWNQIINQKGGSNSGLNNKKSSTNRSGGIGFNVSGSIPQAMTSSMLANQSQTQFDVTIESEGVKKAFIKLMGSKDSNEQTFDINNTNQIERSRNENINKSEDRDRDGDNKIVEPKKRKSRFSSVTTEETVSQPQQSTPIISGFVRSTVPLTSSISSSTSQQQQQPSSTSTSSSKRSRWGYSS